MGSCACECDIAWSSLPCMHVPGSSRPPNWCSEAKTTTFNALMNMINLLHCLHSWWFCDYDAVLEHQDVVRSDNLMMHMSKVFQTTMEGIGLRPSFLAIQYCWKGLPVWTSIKSKWLWRFVKFWSRDKDVSGGGDSSVFSSCVNFWSQQHSRWLKWADTCRHALGWPLKVFR